MVILKKEKYYIVDFTHKSGTYTPSQIYSTLKKHVRDLNIPCIPVKSETLDGNSFFAVSTAASRLREKKNTGVKFAFPQTVDNMLIYKMVTRVNHELEVTLLGEQDKTQIHFAADPQKHGLTHFILGEYEG